MTQNTKSQKLEEINQRLKSLTEDENNWIANFANAAALLFNNLSDINWAGFYLLQDEELVLGPFQGLPACIRIQIGDGVCGQAVAKKKSLVVKDVEEFPGHIVCDPASKSEIVIPLFTENDKIKGVIDIDSPVKNRFDEIDEEYLKKFNEILIKNSNL